MQLVKKPRKKNYINNTDLLIQLAESRKQKKMTNELAAMLQELCARYASKGNWVNYCVDEQTAALTKRGWMSYDNISTSDEILSYNVDTRDLVWSKILDLYVNDYEGDMHYLTVRGMDALVTPGHKFVSLEYGLKPVEEIICHEHIVLMGNPTREVMYDLNSALKESITRFIPTTCKAQSIDFHGGMREEKPNIPTQKYNGTIWCPQTEYGTFVARRNGCIYASGNTYNEDMQAYAMMMLVRSWDKFKPEISNNPFAFFTQCVKNFYRQYLNQEKKHRDIRDELMVSAGLTPSHTYQIAYEEGEGRLEDRSSSFFNDPTYNEEEPEKELEHRV